jgi:hypothetical protein
MTARTLSQGKVYKDRVADHGCAWFDNDKRRAL